MDEKLVNTDADGVASVDRELEEERNGLWEAEIEEQADNDRLGVVVIEFCIVVEVEKLSDRLTVEALLPTAERVAFLELKGVAEPRADAELDALLVKDANRDAETIAESETEEVNEGVVVELDATVAFGESVREVDPDETADCDWMDGDPNEVSVALVDGDTERPVVIDC